MKRLARKKREDPPKPGAAWMNTFADLMNLLLCFFVLLFSMSTVDAQKFEQVAASFAQSFSIFTAGASAIGDGILVSAGVSQLNELDEFMNSTGKASEVEEAIEEESLDGVIDIDITSQYVQLTLQGSLLFDSGSAVLKEESLPVLDKIGVMLERYSESTIEIEGHTDNVPMSGAKYSNNDELSGGRSLSVFNYLIANTNLDPSMVKHAGRGEYMPIADNSTPEGRAMNRRVEIRIYNSMSSY